MSGCCPVGLVSAREVLCAFLQRMCRLERRRTGREDQADIGFREIAVQLLQADQRDGGMLVHRARVCRHSTSVARRRVMNVGSYPHLDVRLTHCAFVRNRVPVPPGYGVTTTSRSPPSTWVTFSKARRATVPPIGVAIDASIFIASMVATA
jgi:hypothetical protein